MAYGQTSAGKTYSLIGTNDEPGIVPRFTEDLFGLTEYLPNSQFSISCSFFEIYNETIYDLLNPSRFLF